MHLPVLCGEAIDYLNVRPGLLYCDATVGLGGHAEAILERLAPGGRLIGIDRDGETLKQTSERLMRFAPRVILYTGNFCDLPIHLESHQEYACDGILLDLGISSWQLDQAERGFSFQSKGPLDMRMNRSAGPTAHELLATLSVDQLADLLMRYGEQPAAHKVARAIKEALRARRLETTTDLAGVVAAVARRRERIHPATRVFMALRIAVNNELTALEQFLQTFPPLLRPGGRVVVIAFHSLEDRLVKHCFQKLARDATAEMSFRLLTRKPVRPSAEEMARNPRSRSARLRAAERVA